MEPVSEPPISVLVEGYLAHCRAAGLSPKTIRFSYGYPLREVLLPWCAEQGITSVDQLTTRHIDRLAAHLMDVGGRRGKLSEHSVWTYMKAVRRFLAWARGEGEKVNAEARLPKLPERLVEILEPAEIDQLEDTATTERDKLIVRVLAETGVRRAELAALRVNDLQDQAGSHYLHVQGKGRRDRLVPIEPALYRRLRRFRDGRPVDADSDRLFLALARDHEGRWMPLSDSGVTQMITTLGERSGIRKKITPHVFRHTAATLMLRSGMNPLLVAQVLGHNSLQMITRVYAHLTPTDAHRALMLSLRARRGE